MSNRDTFIASVKTAAVVKVASDLANEVVRQTTIEAQRCGYTLQTGNYTNLLAAYVSAQKTAVAAGLLAEMNRQVAVQTAKDVLRNTGDLGPV